LGLYLKFGLYRIPVYSGLGLYRFHCIIILEVVGCGILFNNISVISWWSVVLVEETGGPGENH